MMRHRFSRFGVALAMLLTTAVWIAGCSHAAARPEFPLTEETVTAALEKAGLDWTVTEIDDIPAGTTPRSAISLRRGEIETDQNSAFITSFVSEDFGRTLQILLRKPGGSGATAVIPDWDDMERMFELSLLLYGGFDDCSELYKAAAVTELPLAETTLFHGALSGGYCHVTSTPSLASYSEAPSQGCVLQLLLFESEAAFNTRNALSAAANRAYQAAKAKGPDAVEEYLEAMSGDKKTRDDYLAPFMEP